MAEQGTSLETPSRTGKGGNPFKTKQGNQPSCRDQEGRRGPDVVVLGTSVEQVSQCLWTCQLPITGLSDGGGADPLGVK